MKIEIILSNNKNSNIIKNLYPLYLYDLSEIYGNVPNEYGIYEDKPIKTLEEQCDVQDVWFQKPDQLFPFIFFVDEKPAGFALVATGEHAPRGADYYVYEFFLLRQYRGKDIAEISAKQVFDKFQGKWELYTNPSSSNKKGQSFWNKTINNYTLGNFEKVFGTTFDGEKLIFRFNNKVDNMDIHFNKCASDYDRHFYEDLGMCEFYDEIEKQIYICGKPKNILVLGCGTGLEIERIKYSATVTAIDISYGMLAELKKKKLHQQVILNTICNSYFDVKFTEKDFDLVLSTYSLHHFTVQQKEQLYTKIYNCLKPNGYFINGDTVCIDKDTEIKLRNQADELYKMEGLPFGSIHIDAPLALDTEFALLSEAGFNTVLLEKRWNKTALMKAIK